jgi:flagellar motor switch protein FliG
MPTMVAEKIDSKTRQVAILLTSVDTQTARQLLSQFPTEQAKRIRSAMTQLGPVSPEERRAALDQFHRMTQATQGSTSKTEASPAESLLQASAQGMDAVELSDQAKSYEKSASTPKQAVYANPTTVADATLTPSPWAQLTAHELSEILMAERPIVIAVVLNQVPMQLAASLLQLLPEELAIASLGKLPQVQGTPQDILQEIQEQLEQRMESHRLPLRAAQEGIQRLRSILDIADQRFRSQCMQHICREEPTLARRLGWEAMAPKSRPEIPTDDAPARAMPDPAVSIQGRVPPSDIESTSTEPAGPIEEPSEQPEPTLLPFPKQESSPTIRMSFEEVTLLPPNDLVQVLHAATPEVVLLALSGASDQFYQRVRKLLSPKDAKRLDARMSQTGTLQLRDVDRAQQQLAEIASKLLATGKIGSLVSLTITAVA